MESFDRPERFARTLVYPIELTFSLHTTTAAGLRLGNPTFNIARSTIRVADFCKKIADWARNLPSMLTEDS